MNQSEQAVTVAFPPPVTDAEDDEADVRAWLPDNTRRLAQGCYETMPTNHEFR